MIKIFLNYLLGYLNITIEGFFIERFINSCTSKKIFLWGIKRENASILNANISIIDFRRIKKIMKQSKCRVKINQKKGLPFFFHRYQKRKIFVCLLIPVIALIVLSSRFIWNIEIIGAETINKDELMQQLNEQGLATGKRKGSIPTKEIIAAIRLQRTDISWMEINLKGTNAIVNIVEAQAKPDIVKAEEHCNIVSDKKGIITKITAKQGTPLVKVGEIVAPGTPLIGGYMEGKYTDIRYVHAQGEVIAKVWYTKKKKSTFTREINTFTGNKKNRYTIFLHNFPINLYKSIPNFEKYDTISENKKLRIFSNFYLPITVTKNTYQEIKTEKITYGKQELQNILIAALEEEFQQKHTEGDTITNKIVNVYQTKDNTLEVEMTYEKLETIGTEEKLKE